MRERIKKLQASLERPILIKKKENLLYLTGRSFITGYLLVKPMNTDRGRRINTDVVFLGDGLERIDGVKSDFLKNVGKYIKPRQALEVFGEFTYAEVKYIRSKNKELRIKVNTKHSPVDYQRIVKEPGEIERVKKSMQIVERVFKQVRSEIKKLGMTEIGLANFIKRAGYRLGAEDIAFSPIVASGANAAVPHHVPTSKHLKAGEPIIIDFGFKYKNYCSDFTRTMFLKRVSKRLEMAYNQVEKAYNESMELIDAGDSPSYYKRGLGGDIKAGDVYQKAVDVLKEKHLEKYFIHSLGHGTGLEIHELPNLSPNSKDILQNGMVFSIEPGVYIPNLGGVRIEDLVYLSGRRVERFINIPTDLKFNVI
jgi:Xaa-Pro aminopeptidase